MPGTLRSTSPDARVISASIPMPAGGESISVHLELVAPVSERSLVACLRNAEEPFHAATTSRRWRYSDGLRASFVYCPERSAGVLPLPVARLADGVRMLTLEFHPWGRERQPASALVAAAWIGVNRADADLFVYRVGLS